MNQTVSLKKKESKHQHSAREQYEIDVLIGLSSHPKFMYSKYFYDDAGSDLFSKITLQDEYYLTDCEFKILNSHRETIRQVCFSPASFEHFNPKDMASGSLEQGINFVELGSGDAVKTRIILQHLVERGTQFQYIPVDISRHAMAGLMTDMQTHFPSMKITGIVGEYIEALQWIKNHSTNPSVVFFLGSNIGNFNREQALVFLRTVWRHLNAGDLLFIGFDLKKDINTLLKAYNDSNGVTKAFNLNMLSRLNRELDGDFNPDKFDHYGTYNANLGAMESYIISLEEQDVRLNALGKTFSFKAFEPIHVEYSFKYLESDIVSMAKSAGFEPISNLFDSRRYFCDSIWRVRK